MFAVKALVLFALPFAFLFNSPSRTFFSASRHGTPEFCRFLFMRGGLAYTLKGFPQRIKEVAAVGLTLDIPGARHRGWYQYSFVLVHMAYLKDRYNASSFGDGASYLTCSSCRPICSKSL